MAHSKKILVIENDEWRGCLCSILEETSHEVIAAENGLRGFQRLQHYSNDIIIIFCGCNLPTVDGPTFVDTAQQHGLLANKQLILVGHDEWDKKYTDQHLVVRKPFNVSRIQEIVKHLI